MPETQCQGDIVQQPSAREVVVWVNENGDPIDPNVSNQSQPPVAPTSQENVSKTALSCRKIVTDAPSKSLTLHLSHESPQRRAQTRMALV